MTAATGGRTVGYEAAWVPDDDPHRDWDDAASLAVEWTLRRASTLGAAPLLVTPTQHQWRCGVDSISWLAQHYEATTPRSNRAGGGPRAVVAYVPDHDTLQLAARYARGGALAVVETVATPLRGWATEVAAINLIDGHVTPDHLTDDQRGDLEHLHFVGNNGWSRGYGRDVAVRLLRDMQTGGRLDADMITGYMVARGHSGKTVEQLVALIPAG